MINFLKPCSSSYLCVDGLSVEYLVANKRNPLVPFNPPQNTDTLKGTSRQFQNASGEIAREKQKRGEPGSTPGPRICYIIHYNNLFNLLFCFEKMGWKKYSDCVLYAAGVAVLVGVGFGINATRSCIRVGPTESLEAIHNRARVVAGKTIGNRDGKLSSLEEEEFYSLVGPLTVEGLKGFIEEYGKKIEE